MFSRRKSKALKEEVRTEAAQVARPIEQPQRFVVEPSAAREARTTEATGSCIGSGMSIVGNIECNGPAEVFGQIEGEVRASDLLIGKGAHLRGSIIAQEVTIRGQVNGTIRAVRVRIESGGAVEGDVFHRSLSLDESSLFEGSSRRVENPTDLATRVEVTEIQSKKMQTSGSQSSRSVDIDMQRRPSAQISNGDGSAIKY